MSRVHNHSPHHTGLLYALTECGVSAETGAHHPPGDGGGERQKRTRRGRKGQGRRRRRKKIVIHTYTEHSVISS